MTTPSLFSGTQGYWTIDATSLAKGGDDNGYLDNARAFVLGALSHSDRSIACNNLHAAASTLHPGILNIVGHGYTGIVCTGAGLDSSDPAKCISSGDESCWRRSLGLLAGLGLRFRLWSCHAGAGQPGANLLHDLAQMLNCPCEAPTGFIHCDGVAGFTLEPNACWQLALPNGARPMPVFPPGHHVAVSAADWTLQVSPSERANLSQVSLVRATRGRRNFAPLSLDAAKNVLRMVDFQNPHQIVSPLGALITARIEISFQRAGGTTSVKSLTVYNDRLAFADDAPTMYYDCDDNFATMLAMSFL